VIRNALVIPPLVLTLNITPSYTSLTKLIYFGRTLLLSKIHSLLL